MAGTGVKIKRPTGRREEILEETLKSLGEDSYDKFSLRELAKKLSISLGNLQYYFPTKDDLFFSTCERMQLEYDRKALEIEAAQPDGMDGILHAFEWFIEEFNRPHAVVWLFLGQVAIYNPRFKTLRDESYRSTQNTWQDIIKRSGLAVPEEQRRELAVSILALLDGFSLRNFPADLASQEIRSQLDSLKFAVVSLTERSLRTST